MPLPSIEEAGEYRWSGIKLKDMTREQLIRAFAWVIRKQLTAYEGRLLKQKEKIGRIR